MDFLKEGLQKGVGRFTNEIAEDVKRKVSAEVRRVKGVFIRASLTVVLFAIGIIFITFALSYFFIDYIQLSRTISFLIVGVIALLVGVIVKLIK